MAVRIVLASCLLHSGSTRRVGVIHGLAKLHPPHDLQASKSSSLPLELLSTLLTGLEPSGAFASTASDNTAEARASSSRPSLSSLQKRRTCGNARQSQTGKLASRLSSLDSLRGGRRKTRGKTSSGQGHILVTGGCGYIGSHTIVTLLEMGYDITVVDNLSNSCQESLRRAIEITGSDPKRVRFFNVDLGSYSDLEDVFRESPTFSACIHFAGLKAVGESTRLPLLYYENNLGGTINLLKLMDKFDCHNIVFSSSATVYGSEAAPPLTESSPVGSGITNAYGRSKYMIEEMLEDFKKSKCLGEEQGDCKDDWGIVVLRYFNPVGAHPSGRIGEDPNGIPNNLMPYVAQVAVGRRDKLTIFGGDYPTPDGTGIRDYIHVVDLAEGHAKALAYLDKKGPGYFRFNLGTGRGYSVLDMVRSMAKACGREIKYEIGPRRPGDIAEVYADTALAEKELGWKATRTQEDMCNDIWKWQSSNPNGYGEE